MKRYLLVCAVFPLVLSAAITGSWRATANAVDAISHKPQTIGIYVNLAQTGGQVTGTATAAGALKPIQSVTVSGTHVSFSVAEAGGTTSFALTDLGKTLEGTVTLASGQILPVTLSHP